MITYASIALRNLNRQKKRSILLGGAIAFGIMIVTLINGFAGSLSPNLSQNFAHLLAGDQILHAGAVEFLAQGGEGHEQFRIFHRAARAIPNLIGMVELEREAATRFQAGHRTTVHLSPERGRQMNKGRDDARPNTFRDGEVGEVGSLGAENQAADSPKTWN